MLITAEIRWFLRGTLPAEVSRWFEGVCGNATRYPPRVDLYLALPETDTVGVKLREGLLEVKRKDGDLGLLDLHPDVVSNQEMGYLYEELIRRFSELSNETAGEHFTPREVIRLMVNLLSGCTAAHITVPDTSRITSVFSSKGSFCVSRLRHPT